MELYNIQEVIKPFFDNLGINEIDLEYKNNIFITKEDFIIDEIPYYLYIRLYNNIGTVCLGYTDGIKLYKTETLGQIILEDNCWKTLI